MSETEERYRDALRIIAVWATCDDQSCETRAEAMAAIAVKANETLEPEKP